MKKLSFILLLFFFVCATAQRDTSSLKSFRQLDSTGVGIPSGDPVSSEIGPAGGKLVSSDGRIELTFPAGALIDTKRITIQPTTNLFDSVSGKAYLFEPSGLQFKKPVQVILHYTEEEDETCPADLMAFAMQDEKGKWTSFEYDEWDSTARILKGYLHHFCSFTNVFKIQLLTDPTVMVTHSVDVQVIEKTKVVDQLEQPPFATLNALNKREWFVNGVGGGNAFEGFLKDDLAARSGSMLFLIGNYKAPQFLPEKNPVKLSLGVRYYSSKKKDFVWRLCSTKIIVFDAYAIELSHTATGRVGMNAQIKDVAQFVVSIYPRRFRENLVVDQIKNSAPEVLKNGRAGPFKEEISVNGAEGSIHITDQIKNVMISKGNPPTVHFEFNTGEVLWHTSTYKARGVRVEPVPIRARPIPPAIDFVADGKDQHYDLKTYVMANEEKYILKVKRAGNY